MVSPELKYLVHLSKVEMPMKIAPQKRKLDDNQLIQPTNINLLNKFFNTLNK